MNFALWMAQVLLAAMASGLPIVGVDALALPELIHSGVNGLLAPSGDDLALSEATACLLLSETLRQKLRSASRHIALQHSLPCVAERYEAIYRELCGQARTGWLSYLPSIPKFALAWTVLRSEALALQSAGFERTLSATGALDQSARNVFTPIIKRLRNRPP